MSYQEDDYLMLSGIQHYYFCKRQWGLIHIDQQWDENEFTVEGQLLHKRADNPYIKEKRKDFFVSRAMHISSKTLGFSGILDVVEFYKEEQGIYIPKKRGTWQPYIVEYKRGKKKSDHRDIVQLVAEVICLEETLHCTISKSYLYYLSTNTKVTIKITDDLRAEVYSCAKAMHELYRLKKVPEAEYFKNCLKCSLYDICLPRLSKKPRNVENYMERAILGEEML